MKENRVKVAYVPERLLVMALNLCSGHRPHCISLPDIAVPLDATIERTWVCHERLAIGCLVWHPSFAVVPDGEFPPEVNPPEANTVLRDFKLRRLDLDYKEI